MGNTDDFFSSNQKLPSKIKTEIVRKYLRAWSVILSSKHKKIGYVDLFSGTGYFIDKDGHREPSTPIEVMEFCACYYRDMAKNFYIHFNEPNVEYFNALSENLKNHRMWPHIQRRLTLTHEFISAENLEEFIRPYPCLYFLDPFGYGGYSIESISKILSGRGNDILFFFNFNRFNMDISHPSEKIKSQSEIFLGVESKAELLEKIHSLHGREKQKAIVDHIWSALENCLPEKCYVVPFEFEFQDKERTSHYLVFVSKNITGRKIAREVMSGLRTEEGGEFRFSLKKSQKTQGLFSNYYLLGDLLLKRFSRQQVTVREIINIYDTENPRNSYVDKDYKDSLKQLREQGIIAVEKPDGKRVPDSQMPDTSIVTFLR
ncbi:hypothetical protein GCM10017783_19360 [Deinococcus piscis]|uniref:Three-Cys-motif partner protein TcmP n=1 Tax=Deinococcus piscis TaxID=394230 RepID=A0ABQ3K7Y2_9DEIO|nr:three-Cys-motif partner protein TcmP [Deinococcus piscis]GHG06924.1 hypothetical protein GCM10017783_19360 [Deinococcus piscis]